MKLFVMCGPENELLDILHQIGFLLSRENWSAKVGNKLYYNYQLPEHSSDGTSPEMLMF